MDAADAYSHDREREALRLLRPLRDQLPDSPSVRELVGLCQYRVGNYNAAVKELEAYAELSDAVDQNPVLDGLLPRPAPVAEGRDAPGRSLPRCRRRGTSSPRAASCTPARSPTRAASTMRSRCSASAADAVRDPKEYHLRLWYALADLEERAGNLARARELFDRVRQADPQYVDVAERRAALG